MKNIEADWTFAKKQFQKNWKGLKEEDLEKTHGDNTSLTELLQTEFGIPHEQAQASVNDIMHDIEVSPSLPDTEVERKIEETEKPVYPNKLYEEELPPDIFLEIEE